MSDRNPTADPQPLLRPVRLGALELPNRVVMAPMTRARAANPELVPTDLHATYYTQRAGAGLIVTEGTWVSPEAIGYIHVPGIYTEAQTAGWTKVTEAVHAAGGRIVSQIGHLGAASHPDHQGGRLPAGPSAVNPQEMSFTPEGPKETVTPRALTAAEIATTIANYRQAARNARRAGFDGLEIHAQGSHLVAQFLNPASTVAPTPTAAARRGGPASSSTSWTPSPTSGTATASASSSPRTGTGASPTPRTPRRSPTTTSS